MDKKFKFQISATIKDGSHDEMHVAFFGYTNREPVRIFQKCANMLNEGLHFSGNDKISVTEDSFIYEPNNVNSDVKEENKG